MVVLSLEQTLLKLKVESSNPARSKVFSSFPIYLKKHLSRLDLPIGHTFTWITVNKVAKRLKEILGEVLYRDLNINMCASVFD